MNHEQKIAAAVELIAIFENANTLQALFDAPGFAIGIKESLYRLLRILGITRSVMEEARRRFAEQQAEQQRQDRAALDAYRRASPDEQRRRMAALLEWFATYQPPADNGLHVEEPEDVEPDPDVWDFTDLEFGDD